MAILNHGSTLRTADGGQTTTAIVTASNIGTYGVAANSTYYVGTTQNIFNRASAAQTLTGVSIDGNAATVTTNANLTGHITSVGNATSLGSFTSAQLLAALTDETGTGANVFATSPTLVSPLLGTPTSGNLANCTFPTLNQNTTGSSASCTGNAATATALTSMNISQFTNNSAYLVSAFDSVGTVRSRTAVITYKDHAVGSPTDAAIRSLTNTDDNWIYLDSANAQWGIYHRNIDTALVVVGEQTLPANSIAFIGNNSNKAYICLADGTAYFAGTITGSISGNAATATILATARTIGGVSFNGSANINLPGVNAGGSQNTSGSSASCTGNAASATVLATARTIGGVSFDGSANINLPGVNTAGSQNTTGTSSNITAYTINQSVGTANSPTFAAVTANAYYPSAGITESDIYAQSLSINAYHHGDSLTYDTFQFNAASIYETRATVAASFVLGSVDTSIFKGDRFGGMTIANTVYQARWTWSNTIGYKFFKTLYLGNSTNGNSFTVTIESSGNGTTWTTIATSTAMSNWPGHSWYNYPWNNNATLGYIRITVTPTWATIYDINIYSMRYFCSYSLDASIRLYDWDYSRNVTFPAGLTVTNTITGSVSGNAATATILATARTIGGVSFNGSANINLPGVNTAGTQDTTGNAATATILATARTIGGVSFNGSANINLPGVNTAGTQDTTGSSASVTNGVYTVGAQNIAGVKTFSDNLIVNANVGIGITPTYKLHVNGSFAATTKSFDIPHPTKENKRLVYASLEGPENGVYVRGKNKCSTIYLPDYWTGLVHEDSITVSITSIGKTRQNKIRNYSVTNIEDNMIQIFTDSEDEVYDFNYIVYAERKDVAKLVVEKESE